MSVSNKKPGQSTLDFFVRNLAINNKSPSGLTWVNHPNKSSRTVFVGKPSGCIGTHGYYATRVMGTTYLNHRIVYFLFHEVWPSGDIDHIDGCRTNNDITNLRDVTRAENIQNKLARGYWLHKKSGKYQVQIRTNGKAKYIGIFDSEEEARQAYISWKKKLHPTSPERCLMKIEA